MKLYPRAVVLLSIILALAFWLVDSCVHFFVYREPVFQLIPQDINELWMRIVICLLILSLGVTITRSGTARQEVNALQADLHPYRRELESAIVQLHYIALGVETNQLTPEDFYVRARTAIQPTVDRLMELKK